MEVWNAVVGYEGWYRVSNLGKVQRIAPGQGAKAGRVLRPVINSRGYATVSLWMNGRSKRRCIHHLVAEAFLGWRPKGKEVNHKNGYKPDNRLENLEYVTSGENQLHAYQIGLRMGKVGEANVRAKLTQSEVNEIRRLYKQGLWTQRQLGKMFDISDTQIWAVVNYKSWKQN